MQTIKELKELRIQSKIQSAAEAAAKDWFRRQSANPHVSMYLYYRPGSIEFWIGEEPLNTDWVLANPQRISVNSAIETVTLDIIREAQSLPILATPIDL